MWVMEGVAAESSAESSAPNNFSAIQIFTTFGGMMLYMSLVPLHDTQLQDYSSRLSKEF